MTETCPAHATVHHWAVEPLDALRFDPLLHRLLREEPIARVRMRFGEGDAWLATRYEDVKTITSDQRFSRALTVGRPVTSMTPHTVAPVGGIGRTDHPDHTRLRRLVAHAFNRRRACALRILAQEATDRMVAAMAAQGPPAELTEALTGPLPEQVIGHLLGVPAGDFGRLQGWRAVILSSDASPARSSAVKAEIAGYFRNLADHRALDPGDDLFSELVSAQREGALSRPELISLSVMTVLNALDQVRNQTSTMVYALLTHPEQLALLRAEPALLPRAVEELLRFIPQRNGVGLPRIATEDVVIGDTLIRAGEAVYVSYLAANRDPDVFTDPDRLDLTRDEAPHLAFGHGAHYCLGAALTRMQSEVVLSTLLRELPELRLAVGPDQVRWRRHTVNRGPETLPVAW
ncbi:cytochrome P450 [Streptomyces sp. APSN-46.1]|uniref:cytochrome P450 n=1 Tax=Streptomyces sp. APSN-46.1 TaxID=2929049 RepID=UPI001FB26863|nr:cytochrome P450 [Streptomyces sp. APSN-46.1]MCJ1677262.1 cytochrome P450 [Streptomyces sp. APSN-46.1]